MIQIAYSYAGIKLLLSNKYSKYNAYEYINE